MQIRAAAIAVALGALALIPLAGSAQTPAQVKAAQLATQHAKAVTFQLLDRSSGENVGTVTLQRIGSTRSRIRVDLTNPALTEPRVTLRSGRDCNEPRIANAPRGPILLNPFTGRTSTTIVNLPLTNLQSGNYLLDVQNATGRAQAIDACSRLGGGR
ncbi:MAG TPA: hypothetical protein VHS78_19845 [Candidatus Elarobacter sp.]|jgi:hypothetical protein|nr:hypothetical protein [Candidatus Elarobacter sp.]